MGDRFSSHQIHWRRRSTLTKLLSRQGAQHPDRQADKLQQYSVQVLRPSEKSITALQISLN